ncbi:hypothetical protein FRB96_007950, partial [Tulasnella sp. 330]
KNLAEGRFSESNEAILYVMLCSPLRQPVGLASLTSIFDLGLPRSTVLDHDVTLCGQALSTFWAKRGGDGIPAVCAHVIQAASRPRAPRNRNGYGGSSPPLPLNSTSTAVNEEQHVEIERLKIDDYSVVFAVHNDNAGSEIIGRKWVMKLGGLHGGGAFPSLLSGSNPWALGGASPGGMAAIGVIGSPSTMGPRCCV